MSGLVGVDGKPISSQNTDACPRCGRAANQRVSSGGFGTEIYMLCPCGNDFNKEIKCQPVVTQ